MCDLVGFFIGVGVSSLIWIVVGWYIVTADEDPYNGGGPL